MTHTLLLYSGTRIGNLMPPRYWPRILQGIPYLPAPVSENVTLTFIVVTGAICSISMSLSLNCKSGESSLISCLGKRAANTVMDLFKKCLHGKWLWEVGTNMNLLQVFHTRKS